jgi:hypothetical protein
MFLVLIANVFIKEEFPVTLGWKNTRCRCGHRCLRRLGNPRRRPAKGSSKNGDVYARRGSGRMRLRTVCASRERGGLETGASRRKNNSIPQRADCQVLRLPTERRRSTPEALFELLQDWQRTHTQSSVMVREDLRQRMDFRFCLPKGTRASC